MEYDIGTFTTRLRELMYQYFPYENEYINLKKHANRPEHIRDIAFMNNPVSVNIDTRTFDIGGYMAESKYPYYHILQDSPVIRKSDRANDKTKGSQGKVYGDNVGLRDYNKISFNGKTYSREYAKNIRGKRQSVVNNSQHYIFGFNGGRIGLVNRDANTYKNIHYQYIDKTLDLIAPIIASEFGAKLKRKVNTGLGEDYEMSQEMEREDLMLERMLMSWE